MLLFASLPEAVWNALRRTLLPETLVGEKTRLKLRRAAGHCATEAAQAFYELYLAMLSGAAEGRAAGDENLRVVFDRASDRVCKSCVLCAQCWQKDYVTTLAALNDVTQPMLARGRAEMQDFPYHFSSRCVHLPELIRAINSALFALRERQSLRRQQEENRSLLARQYAGITRHPPPARRGGDAGRDRAADDGKAGPPVRGGVRMDRPRVRGARRAGAADRRAVRRRHRRTSCGRAKAFPPD